VVDVEGDRDVDLTGQRGEDVEELGSAGRTNGCTPGAGLAARASPTASI